MNQPANDAEGQPADATASLIQPASVVSNRLILVLALPVIGEGLLGMLVGWSDAILAGRILENNNYVAAITVANYLVWLLQSCSALINTGSQAIVARLIGGNDRRGANHIVLQSLLLALGWGIALVAVFWAAADALAALMGLKDDALPVCAGFLRIIALSTPAMLVMIVGNACLRAAGKTLAGMWVVTAVNVVNIAFSWSLTIGLAGLPALGWRGIAAGTSISYAVGGVLSVLWLYRARMLNPPSRQCRAVVGVDSPRDSFVVPPLGDPHSNPPPEGGTTNQDTSPDSINAVFHEDRTLEPRSSQIIDVLSMQRILRIGVPGAANALTIVFSQLWFLSIIGKLGNSALAAHGVAIRCESISFLTGEAFGIAAATLVGQSLGAGRPELARGYGWRTLSFSMTILSVMGIGFFTFAAQLFSLFIDAGKENSAEVLAFGIPVLRLIAFAMPALAASIVLPGSLRGAGDTRWPFVLNAFSFLLVRIPLAYALTGTLGLLGAWIAMLVDLYFRGIAFAARFRSSGWTRTRI